MLALLICGIAFGAIGFVAAWSLGPVLASVVGAGSGALAMFIVAAVRVWRSGPRDNSNAP